MRLITPYCCVAAIFLAVSFGPKIASAETYEECVDFGIMWCSERYQPADIGYSICILQQINGCHKKHGGGGGGSPDPVADHFTAEQRESYDAMIRGFTALRTEQDRLNNALDRFFAEIEGTERRDRYPPAE
ncbi:MAG: hypothetical protein AAGG06_02850 [Pseudomonadota bacterium]